MNSLGVPVADPDLVLGRFLLALALATGIAWMLPACQGGPLALDEHAAYWVAGAPDLATVYIRSQSATALPPLSSYLQRIFLWLGGNSELAFRASSLVPFLIAIPIVYSLGCWLGGNLCGGIAAMLFANSPDIVDEVRIARCYGLVVLLAALSFRLCAVWIDRMRWNDTVTWTLANLALVWTHYLAIPATLLQLAGVVLVFRKQADPQLRSRGLRQALAATLMGLAGSFPLVPALLRNFEWRTLLDYRTDQPAVSELVGRSWLVVIPVSIVVCLLLNRVRSKWIPRSSGVSALKSRVQLAILWSVVPAIAFGLVACLFVPTFANLRYRAAFTVSSACLGSWLILRTCKARSLAILAVTAGLMAGWMTGPRPPWQLGRLGSPADDQWKQIANYIRKTGDDRSPIYVQSGLVESNVLIIEYKQTLLSEYAACRMGQFYLPATNPRIGLPSQWNLFRETAPYYQRGLEQTRSEFVWVASATDTDLNRHSLEGMVTLLKRAGWNEVDSVTLADVKLLRFQKNRSSR